MERDLSIVWKFGMNIPAQANVSMSRAVALGWTRSQRS